MSRDLQQTLVFSGEALNTNGRNPLGKNLPLGQGWYKANLRIGITLTAGTAAGPVTNGELDFIKNVLMRTDAGEVLVDLPGRALYNIAIQKIATTPNKDAIAASDATYYVNLPIYFTDDQMQRPEDTILDTSRYASMKLDVTLGTVSDLFTTPGTASVTVTADFEIQHTADVIPAEAAPVAHINYEMDQPADPNANTYIDIQRDQNLSIKRLFIHTASSATDGSGFTGTNDNDVIEVVNLKDHNSNIVQDRYFSMIQDDNKEEFALENIPGGLAIINFVRDGSINSSLWTGNLSKLQLSWTNDATVAANDQVAVARESIRKLA